MGKTEYVFGDLQTGIGKLKTVIRHPIIIGVQQFVSVGFMSSKENFMYPATPTFHPFLPKGTSHWSSLETEYFNLFYNEWKSSGRIQTLSLVQQTHSRYFYLIYISFWNLHECG